MKIHFSLSLFLIFLLPASGYSAFSNFNSILIGEQSAGMGGAYTSMVGDPAAMPWYNPSALSFIKKESASTAVGIYKKIDVLYGNNEDFTKASLRVNQGYFRSLPASTGSIIRFKSLPNWTAALSIVVPDFESYRGTLQSTSSNTSFLSFTDESLWVGGSLGRKINSREGIGITMYYTSRSYTKSITDNSIPTSSRSIIYSEDRQLQQNAVLAILGYMVSLDPKWKLGLSLRTPSLQISGRGSYISTLIDANNETNPAVRTTVTSYPDLQAKSQIPSKFTLGASWEKTGVCSVTIDASYYMGTEYSDLENDSISAKVRHLGMFNLNGGIEFIPLDWVRLRVGAFTNFSSHPTPNDDLGRSQEDKVDQLGFSSNIAVTSGKISYTFGGYYTGGRGKSIQRIDQNYKSVPKTTQVFTMLVGTSYSF